MLRDGTNGSGDDTSWSNAKSDASQPRSAGVDTNPADRPRWQIVHGELLSNARRRAALDAQEARWLREGETIQIWKAFGMATMADYVERTLGYAGRTGRHRMQVARALGHLPELTEALATGELSFSAVKELVRVVTSQTEGPRTTRTSARSSSSCRGIGRAICRTIRPIPRRSSTRWCSKRWTRRRSR